MGLVKAEIVLVVIVLVLVGIIVAVFVGNRPNPERFFTVNGLNPRPRDVEHARAILRRTRIARLTGGLVGLVLGGFAGTTLGTAAAIAGAGIGLLAGTMLGITMAQLASRTPVTLTRTASLTVRDADDYLPRRARRVTFGLAAIVVGYAAFAIVTAAAPPSGTIVAIFGLGIATVIALPVGHTFQRRTVELRRPDVDVESVRVDDALRASALRGIHHATIGVLMCGLLLVGYGAVATQNVTTVRVGDRVVLRVQSLSMIAIPSPFVTAHPRRYLVSWTEPGGARHSKLIRTGDAHITLSSLKVGPLIGIGYWVVVIGFFGALIEWGRAAKAWRRPQMTPTMLGTNA